MATPPPRYISLAEAALRIGVKVGVLTRLIENGTMNLGAIQIMEDHTLTAYYIPEGMVEPMSRKLTRREKILREAKKHEGETVGTTEAMEDYHISPTLLYRCIRRGIIRVVGEPSKGGAGRKTLIRLDDVVFVSMTAEGGKQGIRLFETDESLPPHMLVKHDN